MPTLEEATKKPLTETETAETTADTTVDESVVDATVVETLETETPKTETLVVDESTTKPRKKKAAKPKQKKKAASDDGETTDGETNEDDKEAKLARPPMEMITKDFETAVLDMEIAGQKIKKLPYKCGKLIYGVPNDDGKDFRVIAFKARKKSRSVHGKSRCVFYFGIMNDAAKIIKDITGAKVTTFGKCSVQSKKPVELVLDKVTFNEVFDKNTDKVLESLTKLATVTVEQKTEFWKEKTEAATKKKAEADDKAKAKAKKKTAKKKASDGD